MIPEALTFYEDVKRMLNARLGEDLGLAFCYGGWIFKLTALMLFDILSFKGKS